MKIKPIGNRILIEPVAAQDQDVGGIFLPANANPTQEEAVVLAIGQGFDEDGVLVPVDVKIGDHVLLHPRAGVEVKEGDKTYKIVTPDDLLGVIS